MKYHQGKYTPKYPEKYVGDASNIIHRSGWERKLLVWLDHNPSILKYASEEMFVPYMSPLDNRIHRYFPDFLIQYKKSDGSIRKAMLEVKPYAQTKMPEPRKQTKRYLNEVATYAVNQAKWEAAQQWCKKNDFDFMVITEKELNIK
jgi:hypothetical protein